MKKYIGSVFLLALFACGEESNENGNVSMNVNDGETSSVVANTSPTENNSSEYETMVERPDGNTAGTTSIEYVETKHEFGNVTYPSENIYTFKFKNTGNAPLIIESAKASCGCTVPNKPEEPIMPGEMGEMDVIFRPKEGQQGQMVTKKVTVTANTEPKQTYLQISANVLAPMLEQ